MSHQNNRNVNHNTTRMSNNRIGRLAGLISRRVYVGGSVEVSPRSRGADGDPVGTNDGGLSR